MARTVGSADPGTFSGRGVGFKQGVNTGKMGQKFFGAAEIFPARFCGRISRSEHPAGCLSKGFN
jgi:hypothetical protein